MTKRDSSELEELKQLKKRRDETKESEKDLKKRILALRLKQDRQAMDSAWGKIESWCKENNLAAFYDLATSLGVKFTRAHVEDNEGGWERLMYGSPLQCLVCYPPMATLKIGETVFYLSKGSDTSPITLSVGKKVVFTWNSYHYKSEDLQNNVEKSVELSDEAMKLLMLASPVQIGVIFCRLCYYAEDFPNPEEFATFDWEKYDGYLHRHKIPLLHVALHEIMIMWTGGKYSKFEDIKRFS